MRPPVARVTTPADEDSRELRRLRARVEGPNYPMTFGCRSARIALGRPRGCPRNKQRPRLRVPPAGVHLAERRPESNRSSAGLPHGTGIEVLRSEGSAADDARSACAADCLATLLAHDAGSSPTPPIVRIACRVRPSRRAGRGRRSRSRAVRIRPADQASVASGPANRTRRASDAASGRPFSRRSGLVA